MKKMNLLFLNIYSDGKPSIEMIETTETLFYFDYPFQCLRLFMGQSSKFWVHIGTATKPTTSGYIEGSRPTAKGKKRIYTGENPKTNPLHSLGRCLSLWAELTLAELTDWNPQKLIKDFLADTDFTTG